MLLVITSEKDQMWRGVADLTGMRVLKLNYNGETLSGVKFSWDGKRFSYSIEGVDLAEITSVWYQFGWKTYPKQKMQEPWWLFNRLNREGAMEYLYGVLNHIPWISNPHAIQRAENKMLQLEVAVSLGFDIPYTLVTSCESDARAFLELHGDIIVKPVAKDIVWEQDKPLMFFTNRINVKDNVRFTGIDKCPVILQSELKRLCDLRVMVVDGEAFAASIVPIKSKANIVDWRTAGTENLHIEAYQLPEDVSQRCVDLIRKLGLRFGAMDLIVGTDGKHYFLENNATGGWSTYARMANLPVSEALANALTN